MLKNRKFRTSWSRFRADATATSAVEFAMLAPVFILLLLGMVAYGIYFGASSSIQQLAADAARTALAGMNQTERQTLVASFLSNNASGYLFVDPTKLTYQANDSAADGSQFVVSIQYDARNLPIWNLIPSAGLPATTISRQSTIRVGGI